MNSIIRDRSTGCFVIGPKNITAKINDTFLVKLSTAIAHLIGITKPRLHGRKILCKIYC